MSISGKYVHEINTIKGHISDLRQGRVKEINDVPGSPSIEHKANKLLKYFEELIEDIDSDKKSTREQITEYDQQRKSNRE